MLRISSQLLAEIIAHAREESPRECCGLIGVGGDGAATSVHRVKNVAVNRKTAYFMDAQEQYLAFQAIEDAGHEVGAIYHSHPRSEPVPSPTDVNLAKQWPGMQWMIVGLTGEQPEARTWRIVDTSFHEDPHEVHDGTRVDA